MSALLPNMFYDTHIYIAKNSGNSKTQQRAEKQDLHHFCQAGNNRKLNYIVFLLLLIRPNLQTMKNKCDRLKLSPVKKKSTSKYKVTKLYF